MSDIRTSLLTGVAVGVVLVGAAAPFAYNYWTQEGAARAALRAEIASLNAKLAQTGEALAQVQKASVSGIPGRLDALEARLKSGNDALADIKKTGAVDGIVQSLALLDARVKSNNETLIELKKTSLAAASTPPTPPSAVPDAAIADLRKKLDEDAASRAKIADEMAALRKAVEIQTAKAAAPAPAPAPAASTGERSDLVVLYVEGAATAPRAPGAAPPMSVHFDRIGGLDDNGQTEAIISKLKDVTKGRSGCTIAVAGYADTLGGDQANLAISKKRAQAVAAKLKTAFAGDKIPVTETAWGERRLQDWTRNEVAHPANRRADITVNCKE